MLNPCFIKDLISDHKYFLPGLSLRGWLFAVYAIVSGSTLLFVVIYHLRLFDSRRLILPPRQLYQLQPNLEDHISVSCKPNVNCINKNYRVLKQLKRGVIKPSTTERTIYLKTMGRFGNILFQMAALSSLQKATCAKVKIITDHKMEDILEKVPFEIITKQIFSR